MNIEFPSLDPKIRFGSAIISLIFFLILIFYAIILSWTIECTDIDEVIVIPEGSSVHHAAKLIEMQGCFTGNDITIFKLAMAITLNNKKVIPGRYNFKGIASIGDLLNLITSSSQHRVKVTLLEGWTIEQIADKLNEKLQIDTYRFISLCNDYNFISSLNINAPSAEGFLLK